MKRIITLLLLFSVIFSFASCETKTQEIIRKETNEYFHTLTSPGFCGDAMPLEFTKTWYFYFLEMRKDSPEYYNSMLDDGFFPREGQFVTEDGEEFIAKVDYCYMYHGWPPKPYPIFKFMIDIYDLEGNKLVSWMVTSHASYLPEDFNDSPIKKYWDVIKISARDCLNETEGEK